MDDMEQMENCIDTSYSLQTNKKMNSFVRQNALCGNDYMRKKRKINVSINEIFCCIQVFLNTSIFY
jgi:hypothetical protein